jgi:hypothetical protein
MEFIEKVAVLHVHTDASDGTGSAREVIRAASDESLDVLGINDHRNLRAREEGLGGWNGSLFVLAGAELEDSREENHLLVYGVDALPDSSDTLEQIAFVRSAGGIAVIAHPCEAPGRLPGTRAFPWTAGEAAGGAGVEVWNYMSAWKSGISLRNLAARLLLPDRTVKHPDPGALELWRKVGGCALACPDAHAFRYGAGPLGLCVFPYRSLFRRLRTHILLERELPAGAEEAERRLLAALREGSCFMSNLLHGDARGFRCRRSGSALELSMPGPGSLMLEPSGLPEGRLMSLKAGLNRLEAPEGVPLVIRILREGRTWICCCVP